MIESGQLESERTTAFQRVTRRHWARERERYRQKIKHWVWFTVNFIQQRSVQQKHRYRTWFTVNFIQQRPVEHSTAMHASLVRHTRHTIQKKLCAGSRSPRTTEMAAAFNQEFMFSTFVAIRSHCMIILATFKGFSRDFSFDVSVLWPEKLRFFLSYQIFF